MMGKLRSLCTGSANCNRVAHVSGVLVSASRRNELSFSLVLARREEEPGTSVGEDALAKPRDAPTTQATLTKWPLEVQPLVH